MSDRSGSVEPESAWTPTSRHADTEFIVGNITDPDVAQRLDDYRFHDRYRGGGNATCGSCSMNTGCGKGCPAAAVAAETGSATSTPSSARSPPRKWVPRNVGCYR